MGALPSFSERNRATSLMSSSISSLMVISSIYMILPLANVIVTTPTVVLPKVLE
jgi:hypothetical protein